MKDLALDGSGASEDLTVTTDLALKIGAEAIAQSIGICFNFQRGEWFIDPSVGTPILERILSPRPDLGLIRSTIRNVIEKRAGIIEVTSLEVTLDSNRSLTVRWKARAEGVEDVIASEETLIFGDGTRLAQPTGRSIQ